MKLHNFNLNACVLIIRNTSCAVCYNKENSGYSSDIGLESTSAHSNEDTFIQYVAYAYTV